MLVDAIRKLNSCRMVDMFSISRAILQLTTQAGRNMRNAYRALFTTIFPHSIPR
jgi:hypothetical protein